MERYVKSCWYMAAWSEEIGAKGLSRRILDRPTFLYRLTDGGVAAVLDRCPHRFAPLSKGEINGDSIVCGYHGLTFAADAGLTIQFGRKDVKVISMSEGSATERAGKLLALCITK